MFKNKSSKRALVMSVLSLVLCVSMFVGTTFAWFTDEVVSSNNIIKSGSLDVEMSWSDDNANWTDASTGAIFDYKFWEPGYTEVKYIKIENVGDLAFQFQLNIIPDNLPVAGEVNLADVIDVYMFDANATVDRAAIDAATPVGTLSDLIADRDGAAYGILLPEAGKGSTDYNTMVDTPRGKLTYCIALKMQESAGNEYQNLTVGDGFKVQLLATQYTWENDSFDHIYDEDAMFPPKADVKWTGATIIPLHNVGDVPVDASMQFLPKQNYAEAQLSSYRYWHADFVVSADGPIPADAVTLAGYYSEYCDAITGGAWVGMSSSSEIAAGTEIRLIDALGDMLGGTIFVNYEEICKFSDDKGFKCAVIDNTLGALDGITLNVELRLYETTKDPDNISGVGGGPANEETGKYITINTFSYTFGAYQVSNAADLQAALNNPEAEKIQLVEDIVATESIVVPANADVVLDLNGKTISQAKGDITTAYALIDNKGSLTIEDSVGSGKISFADTTPYTADIGWASNTIRNTGVLVVNGGTIENVTAEAVKDYSYPHAIDAYQGSVTTINGGVVKSLNYDAIRMFCNSTTEATEVNINGGTIINRVSFQNPSSNKAGYGILNITGGEFITTDGVAANVRLLNFSTDISQMKATVTGGTFDKGFVAQNYAGITIVESDWLTK